MSTILTVRGVNEEGKAFDLVRLDGFSTSLYIEDVSPQFPYRIGDSLSLKVYDPQSRVDCDRDTRAWRTGFTVTKHQLLGGSNYIYGVSYGGMFTAFDVQTCSPTNGDESHLPWEHDGMCHYGESLVYHGPIELVLTNNEDYLMEGVSFEFHESLGGEVDITARQKAQKVLEEVYEQIWEGRKGQR